MRCVFHPLDPKIKVFRLGGGIRVVSPPKGILGVLSQKIEISRAKGGDVVHQAVHLVENTDYRTVCCD